MRAENRRFCHLIEIPSSIKITVAAKFPLREQVLDGDIIILE